MTERSVPQPAGVLPVPQSQRPRQPTESPFWNASNSIQTLDPITAFAIEQVSPGLVDPHLVFATSAHAAPRRRIGPIVARGANSTSVSCSTKAVTTASTPGRPLQAPSSSARRSACSESTVGIVNPLPAGMTGLSAPASAIARVCPRACSYQAADLPDKASRWP